MKNLNLVIGLIFGILVSVGSPAKSDAAAPLIEVYTEDTVAAFQATGISVDPAKVDQIKSTIAGWFKKPSIQLQPDDRVLICLEGGGALIAGLDVMICRNFRDAKNYYITSLQALSIGFSGGIGVAVVRIKSKNGYFWVREQAMNFICAVGEFTTTVGAKVMACGSNEGDNYAGSKLIFFGLKGGLRRSLGVAGIWLGQFGD